MIKIEFYLEDSIAGWLRYYQCNGTEDKRIAKKVSKMTLSDFSKMMIETYVYTRMKQDGKI